MAFYDRRGYHYDNNSYERAQNKRKFALFLRTVMAGEEQTFDWNTDARMLFDAIRKGKLHMIRFILEAAPGDLTNSIDIKGKTPLMVSCTIKEELRRSMTVRLLISFGADVNVSDDDGRTVLSHACESRCNDVVDLLVRHHNIDPDIPDNNGNTALMYSAIVGNDVATDILLRHFRRLGLNIDRQNADGFTALLLSAKYGNITCAKILIEQGRASLRHRDRIHGLSTEDWLKKNGFTLEDVTPLTVRLKQRAMYIRSVNSRCYSVPNERERNFFDEMDDDDDDISPFGCFNGRRQYQKKYPVDMHQINNNNSISEMDPRYHTSNVFSRQTNIPENDLHSETGRLTSFKKTDSLISETYTPLTEHGSKTERENALKLPDIKIQKSKEGALPRQNALTSDLKTSCPEKVAESGKLQRSRSDIDLRRWKPHFDQFTVENDDFIDTASFGQDSGMHEMLE